MRATSFCRAACLVAIPAVALGVTACQSLKPAAPSSPPPPPPPVQVGTATNLAGVIKTEQPVYAQPVAANVSPPQRIWTLLPGTEVTAICQSTDPAVSFGDNLYVSWAPDKFGYVYWESVTITTRTPDTNEEINASALKGC
jgi:hypothetical protein